MTTPQDRRTRRLAKLHAKMQYLLKSTGEPARRQNVSTRTHLAMIRSMPVTDDPWPVNALFSARITAAIDDPMHAMAYAYATDTP